MLTDDAFNAVPANACCCGCRHFVFDPNRPKNTWCEFLGKPVNQYGWCGDYELNTMTAIKQGKSVEKS